MGLFSRKKPEPQPEPVLTPEEEMEREFSLKIPMNGHMEDSLGTSDLDEMLKEHAPMHEYRWKQMENRQNQILANQQRILDELTAIRHIYQVSEKAAAPSYHPSNVR